MAMMKSFANMIFFLPLLFPIMYRGGRMINVDHNYHLRSCSKLRTNHFTVDALNLIKTK
jgi:hypothetical protein